MNCNIKVNDTLFPILKTAFNTNSKKKINQKINSLISIISLKYPKGHNGFYTVPNTDGILVNKPIIKFTSEGWTLTSFNNL